ncbi:AMMECR1 domain-containing protein [Poseidonibacter parvus]|uniref:AMMECR1 domain-containing protein n=1 Tax=Poseidonibacter parvus TaxID=1850254 RepID=A0A1P8KK98_9BACT|nr:AmmeMemoRadiSam system protein A [Poseidonibacter parvus]APW64971.1 AMMECR1 domain-containing protein [Poseidonibacter parvus]
MNKDILLKIANDAIACKFDESFKIDKEQLIKEYPFLDEPAACFVTLNLNGELRGCIGSLEAYDMLIDDLISNAYNAAFLDPRFLELSEEEFAKIDLEISILTPAIKLEYKDKADLKSKIKVGLHGVVLMDEEERSTFLPQVWEQYQNFEEFFEKLIIKGNFDKDCLDKNINVLVYEVIKVK